MNAPQFTFHRPLKWAAALLRVLLWVVGSAWLLLALTWGAIHGIIVPRIGDWRAELEVLSTRAVGVPVRIGGIRAQTHGLVPSFELTDVRLLDAQGRDALVLPRVQTAVSATSLWRLGFEQVHIDRPELAVRRLPDGRLEVAGLDVLPAADPQGDSPVLDWLFSQTELVIQHGTVHWTDDLRQQPTLTLDDVDLVVRNPGWRHLLRMDATPSGGLSQRVSLQADMRSPFLSLHPGRWADWSGTTYAHLPGINLARLARPAHLSDQLGLTVAQGQGALRLWVDVRQGQVEGSTVDVALTGVNAQFAQAPQPLVLNAFQGRLSLQRQGEAWALNTDPLVFETRTGQRWQQGPMKLLYSPQADGPPQPGALQARQVSLAALHELGAGLPLPGALNTWLERLQPQGTVSALQLDWMGDATGWRSFQAKGRVEDLTLAPADSPPTPAPASPSPPATSTGHPQPSHTQPRRPGVTGATIDFDLNQDGGQARLSMGHGQLVFPGVFEEPAVPMDKLSAELRWQLAGEQIQVQFNNVRFANADLQGQASGSWHTSDPTASPSASRFPGVLKLNGSLSRGKGERVHRYLPLVISPDARAYVKAAILGGQAHDVHFRVAGDLYQMPFESPSDGEFHIAAKVSQVNYAFVPPTLTPADHPLWPVLKQVEGELVFDRASMVLNVTQASVAEVPGLRVTQARARIANLSSHGVVEVNAQLDGPLADALTVVNHSPLADMTGHALQQAQASGTAAIQFGLALPLTQMDKTTVKGHVLLAGNDLQITPDTPRLGHTRARVDFSDQGFQVATGSARLAGGELQFSGGMRSRDGVANIQFKGQGQATAEGLRQASDLGVVASLAEHATGATSYGVQLNLVGGRPTLAIQSSLQGLALNLPAPLNKPADAVWPLRVSQQASPSAPPAGGTGTDVIALTLATPQGPLVDMTLHRDLTPTAASLRRGLLLVGQAAARTGAPLPAQGLTARIAWPSLDVDEWAQWLNRVPAQGTANLPVALPQRVLLETDQLNAMDKTFHQVSLDASRQGSRWLARVQARELAGQLDYQAGTERQGAQLVARLDRLSLSSDPPTPSAPARSTLQPQSIPSLDVVVNALDIDGLDLGHLELQAENRQTTQPWREWRLTQLNLKVPEAQLSATGNWAPTGATSGQTPGAPRTVLNFKLNVQDSGALLTRMGMPGVFKGGKGQLDGTLGWLGAPYAPNTSSLSGHLKLDVAAGQFLKADPGLAKLLGVLSLQSLPRRLALDFRDVFAQGFAFDFVRGDARIEQGVAHTSNLQMKGPNAAVLMDGQADIGRETQDIRALVVPEINAGTASLIATIVNPAVGLGTFLAQLILQQPLMQASTQTFRIHGTWADPQVERIHIPTSPGASHPAQ
jgi:uncharacterized protein (TIGR02099 family)